MSGVVEELDEIRRCVLACDHSGALRAVEAAEHAWGVETALWAQELADAEKRP